MNELKECTEKMFEDIKHPVWMKVNYGMALVY